MEYPEAKAGFHVFHGPDSIYQLLDIECPSSPSTSHTKPYRFNLYGPPIGTLAVKQYRVHFPTPAEWDLLVPESIWRVEPSISDIKEVMGPVLMQLCLTTKHLNVEFFATGSFKRTYKMTACHQSCSINNASIPGNPPSCEDFSSAENAPCTGDGAKIHLLLQLIPSIYPWFKTESEVSTMEFLRARTTLPIPRIYGFDSSVDNDLGFEWILMEKTPGKPYDKMKIKLDSIQRKQVQKTINCHVKEYTKLSFKNIGSIYCDWNVDSSAVGLSTGSVYKLGPIVDMKHLNRSGCTSQTIRKTHQCIKEYLAAFINSRLKNMISEEVVDRKVQTQKLLLVQEGHGDIPRRSYIPRNQQGSLKNARFVQAYRRYISVFENCLLLAEEHDKMQTHLLKVHTQENTFYVDSKGNVTGIYDWDCVVALPMALMPKNGAQILPARVMDGLVLMQEQLTEELETRVLAAKDMENEKQGAAMGRLMRLVATYVFGLEDHRERAERLVGMLERWDKRKA